jgi:plastocyanin
MPAGWGGVPGRDDAAQEWEATMRQAVLSPAVFAVGIAAGLAGMVALATPAAAKTQGSQVAVRDDCDPATFNAALGPGACVGSGDTTFDELITSVATTGAHPKWINNPNRLNVDAGKRVSAYNKGGEGHTFTEVAAFGGGCVDALNQLLGLTPVPECANPANFPGGILAPGTATTPVSLSPGTHTFQCLIHPWMHTTVQVSGRRPA